MADDLQKPGGKVGYDVKRPAGVYEFSPDDDKPRADGRRRVFRFRLLSDQTINELMEMAAGVMQQRTGVEPGSALGMRLSMREACRNIIRRAVVGWSGLLDEQGDEVVFDLGCLEEMSDDLLHAVGNHIWVKSLDAGAEEKKSSVSSQTSTTPAISRPEKETDGPRSAVAASAS